MHSEFEMSMMGELNFFLGLQIKQLKEGTFINQAKYIRDLLKRSKTKEAKTMKTPMSSSIKLDKDEQASSLLLLYFSWILGKSRLPLGHRASAQPSHLSLLKRRLAKRRDEVQFEATFFELMMSRPPYTTGPSSQPSFTKPLSTEIPSHQAPHVLDHAHWMDLSTQISSLDTRMEELVVVSDTQFYSMEDHMDQYQTGFTS
ncbi:hypothetical protein CK203_055709 [Vitis vinifera]|uniref:Reverse transcriptase Ty1/copia-type domain-containing protein n=1 Tax=Vitis vinifera TaxID=29760 RepID=A0A438FV87_VITVI|nr:hypothetical protein CK203_055709 [Vitis vinifera]